MRRKAAGVVVSSISVSLMRCTSQVGRPRFAVRFKNLSRKKPVTRMVTRPDSAD